jgi:hypothetical protein
MFDPTDCSADRQRVGGEQPVPEHWHEFIDAVRAARANHPSVGKRAAIGPSNVRSLGQYLPEAKSSGVTFCGIVQRAQFFIEDRWMYPPEAHPTVPQQSQICT